MAKVTEYEGSITSVFQCKHCKWFQPPDFSTHLLSTTSNCRGCGLPGLEIVTGHLTIKETRRFFGMLITREYLDFRKYKRDEHRPTPPPPTWFKSELREVDTKKPDPYLKYSR